MSFQDIARSGAQQGGQFQGSRGPAAATVAGRAATSGSLFPGAAAAAATAGFGAQGRLGLGYQPPPPATAAFGAAMGGQTDSGGVAAGVFQMNTAVSTFRRLVNSLGTAKDTPELREKLHKSRQYIAQLAKETSAKLKDASEHDHAAGVSTSKKLGDAKLARDFQGVLREFERAQHLAAEREAAYVPVDSASALRRGVPPQPAAAAALHRTYDDSGAEQLPLMPMNSRQRQELAVVENELQYNEAVIEEREQGIAEIQQQIVEVNEIFRDLAVLVKEQGVMIDDIESNVESSHAQTVQGNKQLVQAAKNQRESNSFTCWVMGVFAIGLFILFLILSS